jgi:UDP-2,3-diacylglucosamine pyrophosphatase LpxH
MYTFMRLKQAYFLSDHMIFDDSSRLVFFSDCHRGDGSTTDSFLKNRDTYLSALDFYYSNGFTYIELGDGDELWKNNRFSMIIKSHIEAFLLLQKFYLDKRLYMIWGNHDIFKSCKAFVKNTLFQSYDSQTGNHKQLFQNIKIHEGLILEYKNTPHRIFAVHGHQGDILNDFLWPFSCLLIRRLWMFIKILQSRNRSNQIRNEERLQIIDSNMRQWSKSNNLMVIAGHTHNPYFPQPGQTPYFNDGCCVKTGYITCIEIQNGEISLVKWSRSVRSEGIQSFDREVLAGPEKISAYFD